MHDLLCAHSPVLGRIHLNCCAEELELDLERFEREMREHTYIKKVREDFASGIRSGVTQMATFLINGTQYTGASDLDSVLVEIDEAATRAGSSQESPLSG